MIAKLSLKNEINCWQKMLLISGSGLICLFNPYRDDMVAALGELTSGNALLRMRQKMTQSNEGRQILLDRPRVNLKSINFQNIKNFPDNSFGKSYYNFMTKYNITPDSRKETRFISDSELSYVIQRYREVHDMWHVLFSLPINLFGELALKSVEFLQTGLPMPGLSALLGPLALNMNQKAVFLSKVLPWAIYNASRSVDLMSVYYEMHLKTDLNSFRRDLGITPFPSEFLKYFK